MAIQAKPVQRAVGNDKIARRMQWPAGGPAVHDVEHPRMADRGDSLAAVVLDHQLDRLAYTPGKTLHALAGLEIVFGIARLVVRVRLRVALRAFVCGDALKYAEVALAQLRQFFHLQPAPRPSARYRKRGSGRCYRSR